MAVKEAMDRAEGYRAGVVAVVEALEHFLSVLQAESAAMKNAEDRLAATASVLTTGAILDLLRKRFQIERPN